MQESSNLKVSVWAEFVPHREIIVSVPGEQGLAIRRLSPEDKSGLQKEIFGWRMLEDPFGGVANNEDRQRLKAALLEALEMGIEPNSRSVGVLQNFIKEAKKVIDKGGVEWTGSISSSGDSERRVNPLLALVNQLTWLANIFNDHPNVSITVR